jgi:hypothetical protein
MKLKQIIALSVCLLLISGVWAQNKKVAKPSVQADNLKASFITPPDSVRPGVYWYFMDGNLSREGMTKDLESMKKAGIGNVLFLEVNIGVPRGPIDFMSEQWQELFKHAVSETKRLGMTFTLGIGPGWSGSGGPWVKPAESMQHLVYSVTEVSGPTVKSIQLPKPDPRKPYFGEKTLNEDLKKQWLDYYQDAFVLAFPTPSSSTKIQDIDEKALYYREPFSSKKGVKPFLPEPLANSGIPAQASVDPKQIVDLTKYLQKDGTLNWKAPAGKWTIMRFGSRNNGAITRPAPLPGLGFECDKFDTVAFRDHLDQYVGKLLKKVENPQTSNGAGWNMLHMDSWEMGAQNWTANFRKEFQKRRGYDPLPYFPVYSGQVVGNAELSERFLWDLRQTSQELVVENHALYLKKYGRKYGFRLSIEPYDMNPCADFDLGSAADVPMCEFWSKGYGFKTAFSCIEASSIANIIGAPVVGAESFTSESKEAWKLYPTVIKNQGDWAFCTGINRFVYHTFAHKPLDDKYQPGMTMAQYGVHWDRGQTWWPLASGYHTYVSRCSHLLQQGRKVADILYLIPEGAPHVFLPPASAMEGNDTIPDHKGYNFDGCSAQLLISKASVSNKKIVFPGGASYQVLVLPNYKTMTPKLLDKIASLVRDGATVIGNPPVQSPSLVGYPLCDAQIQKKALSVWQSTQVPAKITKVNYGKGTIFRGGNLNEYAQGEIYPSYDATKAILKQMNVAEDFTSTGEIRYIHKTLSDKDIYFVSNRTNQLFQADCTFRRAKGFAELWDPINGKSYSLPQTKTEIGTTTISLDFDRYQSYFVVFSETADNNLPAFKSPLQTTVVQELTGNWQLAFDPRWGGPESITFSSLDDWSKRPEEGIKYYSGIATYKKSFSIESLAKNTTLFLNLGEVSNMARVKLNGQDLGIVWTAPWQVDITSTVKSGENQLEIEVANLWANRLIGDENYPDDGVKDKKWPEWLLNNQPRPSQRYTFTTHRYYKKDMPLLKSGLIGPVTIIKQEKQ